MKLPKHLTLLRTIGSPLSPHQPQVDERSGNCYVPELYSIAEANKIPLTYLNAINPEERRDSPKYNYHYTRFCRLMEIASEISELFNEEGIDYVIFKTLRHCPEDVSDIDVLNLGSHRDYNKMVEAIGERGYIFMEKGGYCTTLQDYKTRFKTEAMIDIYDQISVGHLIYLDKRKLSGYIVRRGLPKGGKTNVFAPEAELLVIIAHSVIKENTYILADYYATLHYLALMDPNSIERLIGLIRENKLVNSFRWHLTITATLHKLAHGFVPKSLSNMLTELGGLWRRAYKQVLQSDYPPYKCDPTTLVSIFREKLHDVVFRKTLLVQLSTPSTKVFTARLLARLRELLR